MLKKENFMTKKQFVKSVNLFSAGVTAFVAVCVICVVLMQQEKIKEVSQISEQQQKVMNESITAKKKRLRISKIHAQVLKMMIKKLERQTEEDSKLKKEYEEEISRMRRYTPIVSIIDEK